MCPPPPPPPPSPRLRSYSRDKLDTLVEFPLERLDMSPYLLPRSAQAQQAEQAQQGAPLYDLYAVSNHYGSEWGWWGLGRRGKVACCCCCRRRAAAVLLRIQHRPGWQVQTWPVG